MHGVPNLAQILNYVNAVMYESYVQFDTIATYALESTVSILEYVGRIHSPKLNKRYENAPF
jgi:hypothetical protein